MINKKGFTLIEMIISTVALLMMMATVYYLFGTQVPRGIIDETRIDQQQDARMALQRINKDLRGAHTIDYKNSKLTINCFRGKPTVGFPNAGPGAANTETIEYFVDGGKLYYSNKTTSKKEVIAENVKEFKIFIKPEYVAVKIEAEVEVMIERQKYDKVNTTLLTKVYPRYKFQSARYPGFFSWVDEHGDY